VAGFDIRTIDANGWRQGSVCDAKELRRLTEESAASSTEQALAILVSHDCDIVHRNTANEPNVEWLVAHEIEKLRTQFLYGKNPRRLHFEHAGKCYEALAHNRLTTPRDWLCKFASGPLPRLPSPLTGQIAIWLGKRYSRPAFPDEFNKRLGKNDSAIRETITRGHDFLRAILIRLDPSDKELAAEEAYQVSLFGVMFDHNYKDAAKREKCQALISEIESLLSECTGVQVNDCMLRSDVDVSLADLDVLVEWDFDYLTVSAAETPDETL
jgi:hypothetical protein